MGGILPQEEYEIIEGLTRGTVSLLVYKGCLSARGTCTAQITNIAQYCGIQVTPQQIDIYYALRRKRPSSGEVQKSPDFRTRPTGRISDQDLVGQVILATEGNSNNFQTLTRKYSRVG